jgi:hypothetical protein
MERKMQKLKNILSIGADAKTVKGQKLGFLTGILYLAPSDLSGHQVCPMAKLAGCEAPCLNSAGRGAFSNVQAARIAKTKRFFDDRAGFMADLVYSIDALIRQAERLGLTPLVRLNGTSDIAFENIPVIVRGFNYANIFNAYPGLAFYDYTKIPTRKNIPANYDLTFSYSGVVSFAPVIEKAVYNKNLARIAVVFDRAENIPERFLFSDVVPGDDSDVRHLDARGVVVGLYAKGKARSDRSGFVVRTN